MEFFGDLERFLSEDLYPYRWPLTIGLAVAALAAVALAFKLGWHRVVQRHPLASGVAIVAALAVAIPAGWYTLSPLWERSYLEEASPLEAAALPTPGQGAPGASPDGPGASGAPRVTHVGDVQGADDFHFGRGTAQLIETAPGRYTLRFEDFSVRNGPDLYVYLTPDPTGESIDGAIDLGGLKATDGAFNYEIPEGTDPSRFSSAIVWCRQFAVLFAVAELQPV
jgi:hypothetical protein